MSSKLASILRGAPLALFASLMLAACGGDERDTQEDGPLGATVLLVGDGKLQRVSLERDRRVLLGPADAVMMAPDGTRAIIQRGGERFVMDLADGSAHDLELSERQGSDWAVVQTEWSPDSRQIAYLITSTPDVPGSFGIIHTESMERHELVSMTGDAGSMVSWHSWAPDGRHLAYVLGRRSAGSTYPYTSELRLVSSDGTADVVLVERGLKGFYPTGWDPYGDPPKSQSALWNPDGSALVFVTGAEAPDGIVPPEDVWIASAEGHDVSLLKSFGATRASVATLSWASDARHLSIGTNDAITVMNRGGEVVSELQYLEGFENAYTNRLMSTTWSPIGARLAYVASSLQTDELHVFDADGGDTLVASRERKQASGASLFNVFWDPLGELLTYNAFDETSIEHHRVGIDGSGDTLIPRGRVVWGSSGERLMVALSTGAPETTIHIVERSGQLGTELEAHDFSGFRWVHDDDWFLYWGSTSINSRRSDGSEPRLLWEGEFGFVP